MWKDLISNVPSSKLKDVTVSLTGRIHNIRASGQKLRFYDLYGEGAKVQIMAQAQDAPSTEEFLSTHSDFRRGDIVSDSPELSIYEPHMAYADMYDLIDMTESLVTGLVQHLTGGTKITYHPDGKAQDRT